ncbi:wiskott-Aldrich syndrome protein homolog 1-like [Haliotis rubra]|uniref:wiskott-Aldrich syndrome protein homolog 1-like n=1 Tax=Haliotis rubra TaxID=36100 RepID=UPI001EE51599|nr:wiskott-Aldrich syndrome protein homolog 1-like [Haliotis rubra]
MATAPVEYVILDMNANGDTKAGMRKERKRHIADVLESESPLVVCLQEFDWKGIHSSTFKDIKVSDHFQYEGHKEAGFIFDTREITYSRIDNKTSVRNMYDSMVRRGDMGSDYFVLPRLRVYKIQSKGAPHFEILCASWHGPHRVSMEIKKMALDTLVKFLLKLKVEEGNVPFLLGGDFNMPASTVKRRLPSNGSLMLNTPDDLSIDMFIISSDIGQIFSISKVCTMKGNSAFDHSHLKIYLKTVNDTNPQLLPPFQPFVQTKFLNTPPSYPPPPAPPFVQTQILNTQPSYSRPPAPPFVQTQILNTQPSYPPPPAPPFVQTQILNTQPSYPPPPAPPFVQTQILHTQPSYSRPPAPPFVQTQILNTQPSYSRPPAPPFVQTQILNTQPSYPPPPAPPFVQTQILNTQPSYPPPPAQPFVQTQILNTQPSYPPPPAPPFVQTQILNTQPSYPLCLSSSTVCSDPNP